MVHREEHNESYTVIDNCVLQNVNLSWEARGFLVYLLSLPNDWNFTVRGIVKQTGSSKSVVLRIMEELKAAGYIRLERKKDKNGRFIQSSWHVYEVPCDNHIIQKRNTVKTEHGKNGTPCSRNTVKPESGITEHGENGTIQNTNNNKILNIQNTKENKQLKKEEGVLSEPEKLFLEFWSVYPKKVDKKGSFRAFKNIPKLKETFPAIMSALEIQKQSEQWTKNNGQFIPNPTTYIHQERWLTVTQTDELQTKINDVVKQNYEKFLF